MQQNLTIKENLPENLAGNITETTALQNNSAKSEVKQPANPYMLSSGTSAQGYYAPKARQPFTATKADAFFTLACFAVGLLFIRWVLLYWQGFGVTAFTAVFAASVLCYAKAKNIKLTKSSWFWFAIMLLCGICFSLWPLGILKPFFSLFLFLVAVLWCALVFGMLMQGKITNFLPLDAINLLAITPFANIDTPVRAFTAFGHKRQGKKTSLRKWLPVLCGVFICILFLAVVLPMLASADSNVFGKAVKEIQDYFIGLDFWNWLSAEGFELTVQFFIGIPVAWYICGLVTGGAHKRYATNIGVVQARKAFTLIRVAPNSTLLIVMWAASLLYIIFIACQIPQFFSAFSGSLPLGQTVYSQYAREGFFELCVVAGINLGLIAVSNTVCKQPTSQNRPLRIANIMLLLLTLLVISTVLSKMGLYISVYGYTQMRVLTSVFMVFLAIICITGIVRQFKAFSIVKLAVVCGSVLLCALALCNLDVFVVRQNIGLYQSGKLENFDEMVLMQSGVAGAPYGWQLYNSLKQNSSVHEDEVEQLAYVLNEINLQALMRAGTPQDTISHMSVRGLNMTFDEGQVLAGGQKFGTMNTMWNS